MLQLRSAVDQLEAFERQGYADLSDASLIALDRVDPSFRSAIEQSRDELRAQIQAAFASCQGGSAWQRVPHITKALFRSADYMTALSASGAPLQTSQMAQLIYSDVVERAQQATSISLAREAGHESEEIVRAVVAYTGFDSAVPEQRAARWIASALGQKKRRPVTQEEKDAVARVYSEPLERTANALRPTWEAATSVHLSVEGSKALAEYLDTESLWVGWPAGDARARMAMGASLQESLRGLAAFHGHGSHTKETPEDDLALRVGANRYLAVLAESLAEERAAVTDMLSHRERTRAHPGGVEACYAEMPEAERALSLRAVLVHDLVSAQFPPSWVYERIEDWAKADKIDPESVSYLRALTRGTARLVAVETIDTTGLDESSAKICRDALVKTRTSEPIPRDEYTPSEAAQGQALKSTGQLVHEDDLDILVLRERALARGLNMPLSESGKERYRSAIELAMRQRLIRAEMAQIDGADLIGADPIAVMATGAMAYSASQMVSRPHMDSARNIYGDPIRETEAMLTRFLGEESPNPTLGNQAKAPTPAKGRRQKPGWL